MQQSDVDDKMDERVPPVQKKSFSISDILGKEDNEKCDKKDEEARITSQPLHPVLHPLLSRYHWYPWIQPLSSPVLNQERRKYF